MIDLIVTADQRGRIEQHGVTAYPDECCGILIGRDTDGRRTTTRLISAANDFDPQLRRRRFSIRPADLIAAEKSCGPGEAVVGFYHSHPDHPARPSEYDRVHAWPFYSYVIVAIDHGTPAETTSWVFNESTGTFEPQAILTVRTEPLRHGDTEAT